MNWFDVDKAGLAKLLEQRGRGFTVLELLQNAWDQDVTRVDVTLAPVPHSPYVRITVTDDDPLGFADLSHAFTLFAESAKKNDPLKRGRFNLGEKLVLACCTEATIASTTGTVEFNDAGRTVHSRRRRAAGSEFQGTMRMTRAEIDAALQLIRTTLPPVLTRVNGEILEPRSPEQTWTQTLQTELADDQGYLRRVSRETTVSAFEIRDGEVGTLYELGIPVVETGDRWHVSVGQKVPLTLDRTNVPPAFLRAVRVGLLNAMAARLDSKEAATETWVRDATGHPDALPGAVEQVMALRFGDKRVSYDPSDREANFLAVANGYTVVSGGALSAAEWENVRRANAVLPAGQVTPSPKPFHPDGDPLHLVDHPTDEMLAFVEWARTLARDLLGVTNLRVVLADDPGWGFGGCYKSGELHVNVARYGGRLFFASGPDAQIVAFLIHEFAHHYAKEHLSAEFYDACCDVGARLALLGVKLH